jgi:hypothetical protein
VTRQLTKSREFHPRTTVLLFTLFTAYRKRWGERVGGGGGAGILFDVNLHVAGGAAVDLVHVGYKLDALAHDEEEHHQDQHTVHVLLLSNMQRF